MKKTNLKILMLTLILAIICIGCGKDNKKKEIDANDITSITVEFYDAQGNNNTVTVDLKQKTKKTVIHGKSKVESEESIDVDSDFSAFIKDVVIEHINMEESGDSEGMMQVIWRIQVWVGEESFHMNGFEKEFPAYWNELLEYMCVVN